jgi:two-component system, chemotaxis family, sensor kinase Cph1
MIAIALDASLLSVFGRLSDPVLIANDERRYVFANAAAGALFELPQHSLVGMRIDDFTTSKEAVAEQWQEFLNQGTQRGPFVITCPSGTVKHVEFTALAHVQPGLHVSIMRDVTEQREAELQRMQLQHLAELALSAGQMGCWIWSAKTGQATWNDRLRVLFDLDLGDDENRTYETFLSKIHPDDVRGLTAEIGKTLSSGTRYETEYRIVRRDGEVRWISDRGEVLFDGDQNRVGISGVVWDITQRRAFEQERANHIRELARSNIDLQRFAQVASHDLKEPLRNVCALSDLLARQSFDKLNDDEREVLHLIVNSAKRMAALIDSMLEYAKTGLRRDTVLTETPVDTLVQQALMNLRLAIEQKNAEVICGDLPSVYCAPLDLVQVFQNLIGNAIKYCTVKPCVAIMAEPLDGSWIFSVKDNGIGIDPSHAGAIFDMFSRLHSSEYPGTGVGLAICKAIVEKHGGRIWVESQTGQGSNFRFSIPGR